MGKRARRQGAPRVAPLNWDAIRATGRASHIKRACLACPGKLEALPNLPSRSARGGCILQPEGLRLEPSRRPDRTSAATARPRARRPRHSQRRALALLRRHRADGARQVVYVVACWPATRCGRHRVLTALAAILLRDLVDFGFGYAAHAWPWVGAVRGPAGPRPTQPRAGLSARGENRLFLVLR